jgi:hypothetical protein
MTDRYVSVKRDAHPMPNAAFAELMKAVLGKGAPFRFEAGGYSMSPFIRHGDHVTVAPPPARFRRGDVAVFMNPDGGKLTVHRVVRVSRRRGYFIKGDNAPDPDGFVPGPALFGRVVRVEHRGKRVRIGLGPERVLVAFLSRIGGLRPAVGIIVRLARPIFRRKIKG